MGQGNPCVKWQNQFPWRGSASAPRLKYLDQWSDGEVHFHRGMAPLAPWRANAPGLSPHWGHCRAPRPPPRGAHRRSG